MRHNDQPSIPILAVEAIEETLRELQRRYIFDFNYYQEETGGRIWQIKDHVYLENIIFKAQRQISQFGAITNNWSRAEFKKSISPLLEEKFQEYFMQKIKS